MRALDQWVRKGLHHARKHRPAQWEAAYDEASPKRFLLWGVGTKVPNALLGVFAASRDQEGRTYPLIVASEVPKHAIDSQYFPYLPYQADSFLERARGLVRRGVEGDLSRGGLTSEIEEMDPRIPIQSRVPPGLKQYLQRTTLGPFLEELFGHFESSEKYQLFSTLLDVLPPLRECSSPRLDCGLRFPMSVPAEVRSSVVAFWMGTVLRLLNYASVSVSIFWTDPAAQPEPHDLQVYVGEPRPRSFFDVLVPEADGGYVLGEAEEKTNAEAALSIPDKYGNMLENDDVRLWDFLRQL